MEEILLGVVLFCVWLFTLTVVVDASNDKNAAVRFLGYLTIFVVTILEFLIILDQYFGIKLSDLIR